MNSLLKCASKLLREFEKKGKGLYTQNTKFVIARGHHNARKMPRTPDLIYVPQVMRWLKNKIRFRKLKSWDPDFSEGAFIFGTTQAVCKISEIIHSGQPEDLNGLLTFSAKMKVTDYMERRLNKVQKQIIKLTPDDIKILIPLNVTLAQEGSSKKDCRVSMRILALKWFEHSHILRLVLVALQTEFLRDYSRGHTNSEWTISGFDILECGILSQAPG